MVTETVTLPNFLCGARSYEGTRVERLCAENAEQKATIYECREIDLRTVRRTLVQAHRRLAQVPLSAITAILRRAADYYYSDADAVEALCLMSGHSRGEIEESLHARRRWLRRCESLLTTALGPHHEGSQCYRCDDREVIRQYRSRGVVVAALPGNSDEESFWVLLHALLSRSPLLIRASSRGVSSLSALEFVASIERALADEESAGHGHALLESIAIVNLTAESYEALLDRLFIEDATFVLFGSTERLRAARAYLYARGASSVLSFGTGFAFAVVERGADLRRAAEEIAAGAVFHRGNECISTAAAYIHTDLFEEFLDCLCAELERYRHSTAWAAEAQRTPELVREIRASGAIPDLPLHGERLLPNLAVLADHQAAKEIPAPFLFLKRFENAERFAEQVEQDLRAQGLREGIACALFTSGQSPRAGSVLESGRAIPAALIRLNRGTHRISIFVEHQGMLLLRELLSVQVVERHDIMRQEERLSMEVEIVQRPRPQTPTQGLTV